jgi:hypothetical protein
MKRLLIDVGAVLGVIAALLLPVGSAAAQTVTVTSTIIGVLAPDPAHYANSLIPMIFPLMGMVVLATIPMMFHRKGDVVIYFALTGLLGGSVFGDMSVTGATSGYITFAQIFVAALLLFLWWWDS